jgi:hypothetical protein
MNLIEQLVEKIETHAEFEPASPAWVSVYRRHQCYGGPEEGGWWHDVDQLLGTIPFATRSTAEKWLEVAKADVAKANRAEAPSRHAAMANLPDIETAYHDEGYIPVGWNDGGELWVTVESSPGQSDNTKEPRPRYE